MKYCFALFPVAVLSGCVGPVYDRETSSLSDYTKLEREVRNYIVDDNQSISCEKDKIFVVKKRTFNTKYAQGKEPKDASPEQLKQFGLEDSKVTFLFASVQDVVSFTDYWEIEKCGVKKRYRIDVDRTKNGHNLNISNFPIDKEIKADPQPNAAKQ